MSETKLMRTEQEKEQREQMEMYGITMEQTTVFRYKDYKYDNLSQALDFARLDRARQKAAGEPRV